MDAQYDYLFKLIVIGDAATGKSCLLHRFTEGRFKGDSTHTIGVEFGSKILELNGRTVKLQIWDTAGQERFRSVTRSYYRGAAACVVVYDITSRESYNHLHTWLNDARALATSQLMVVLVGNKSDLAESRQVSYQEANNYAQENELHFLETSAKTGENVEEIFDKIARSILYKIEQGLVKPDDMGSGIQVGTKAKKRKAPVTSGIAPEVVKNDGCSC